MKDKQHTRETGLSIALTLTVSLWLLAGCSSKPPDCSSPQAASVARTIFAQEFTKVITDVFADPFGVIEPADIAGMKSEFEGYAKALKVDIHDAVQNGYDGDARKFSCSGRLTVTAPTGKTFARNTDYSIQSTADGKDTFVVKVADVGPFVESLRLDFGDYVVANQIPFRYRPGMLQDHGAAATASAPAAAPTATVAPNACIEAKLALARKELDAALAREEKESEEKGYLFKGLSPVAEAEWQEKTLQKAREACP